MNNVIANVVPVFVIIAVLWLGGYLVKSWEREDKNK